jgi:hypothetical protein
MIAEVEQLDHTYKIMDINPPEECFYCDTCGDCLRCQPHDEETWCRTGGRWVIYLEDPLHPDYKE